MRARGVELRGGWHRRAGAHRRARLPRRLGAVALALVLAGCSLGAEATRAHATLAPLAAGHRVCPAEDLSAVIREVNLIRRRSGLYQLGSDTHLARFATSRSAAMARENRLSHGGWERALRRAGLEDDALGENVAYNYDSPRAVIEGWMRSPGHRANILRPAFKRIGVGCVIDGRGHRWWTQDFAG